MAKNQKKGGSNALKAVILLICIAVVGGGFILITSRNAKAKKDEKLAESAANDPYNIIMNYNFENDYPITPKDVVELNNLITLFIYGGTITDEQLRPVLEKERELFSSEIIDNPVNSLDTQVEVLSATLKSLKDRNQKLIKIDTLTPVYNAQDENLCTVMVVQDTNVTDDNYVKYSLVKEYGLWKIQSWEKARAEEREG